MQRGERMTRETSSHGTLFLIFLLFSVFAFGMAGFKILIYCIIETAEVAK